MFIGRMHANRICALEKEIGYQLTFPTISQGWIQSWASFDLSKSWNRLGLRVTGIDYFTMGELVNGVSTRFDPHAEQFQTWIGGYLLRLDTRQTCTLQDYLNVAVVDQINWLEHYGDPHPRCDLRASNFKSLGNVSVSGYTGQLYVGGGFSHSDVGDRNKEIWTRLVTSVLAAAFNINGRRLHLVGRAFVPRIVQPRYGGLYLKGYFVIVEIEKGVRAVLYGSGAVYRDEEGRERDTFETTKHSLLNTMKQVVITRV